MIEVPNSDTKWVKLQRSRHRHFVQDHVSFFSARSLSSLLALMGFKTVEVYYPKRVMSLRHFIEWIGRYNKHLGEFISRTLPQDMNEKLIQIGLKDIVTVIAQKE